MEAVVRLSRLRWVGPRQFGRAVVIVGYRWTATGVAGRHGVAVNGGAEPQTVVLVQGKHVQAWNIDGSPCDPADLVSVTPELERLLHGDVET